VISFQPSRDHDTCPINVKQASDTWSLLEFLNRNPDSIQTPSSMGS